MRYFYNLPPVLIGASIVLVQSHVAIALSPQEIENKGREITVQIFDSENPFSSGSGIIIKHSGDTYTVLTAYHVVKDSKKYQITTPDQQNYAVSKVKQLQGLDLAIVEFSSNKPYNIAKIGNSDQATASTTVYVAGFPARTAAISNSYFSFNKGQVNANGAAQRDGYNFIYDNDTLKGMSGGPVLNEQGEVVGIHGRADEQEISEKSQNKVITGIGTTMYSAVRQLLAVGIDMGVRPPNVNVAAAPKADDFYIKGNEKYDQKNFKGAIADYTEAIRLNPTYAYAYLDRGNARDQLGDKQGAIADYTQAIKINPKYFQAYYNRGISHRKLGDYQKAIADYTQAIKINPNYAYAYNNRAYARDDLEDYQGAIADYTQAIKINPNYADAYYNRAISRHKLGDNQGAIADYTQAIKINPNYDKAYYNRGNARDDLGDNQGAIADYTQAIKINPNDADAYYNRGISRRKLGDYQGAIADYTQAIKINPNYDKAYNNRGYARDDLEDYQGAIADYTQAIKINPNDADTYSNRGISRRKLGDNQGAIADYTQAIKIDPKNANAYYNRGLVHRNLGEKQSAIADFQKAAELYQQQGKNDDYQDAINQIRKLQ